MPLIVTIAINENHLEQITISRLEPLSDPTNEHQYLAQNREYSAGFRHRYDDGYRVCVQKALEALEPPAQKRWHSGASGDTTGLIGMDLIGNHVCIDFRPHAGSAAECTVGHDA